MNNTESEFEELLKIHDTDVYVQERYNQQDEE